MKTNLIKRALPDGLRIGHGAGVVRDGAVLDNHLCVMTAVAWVAGERHTDAPSCADPVIRNLAVPTNDASWWDSDSDRTATLMPLVMKILGTKTTTAASVQRGRIAAHRALTVFAPMALRAAADELKDREMAARLRIHADRLAAFSIDELPAAAAAANSANSANSAAAAAAHAAARSAAAAAHAAAYAAAYAANSAADAATNAAAAAANAAAYAATNAAARSAAYAADAAANAAHAAAAASSYATYARRSSRPVRDEMIRLIEDLCDIDRPVEETIEIPKVAEKIGKPIKPNRNYKPKKKVTQ